MYIKISLRGGTKGGTERDAIIYKKLIVKPEGLIYRTGYFLVISS